MLIRPRRFIDRDPSTGDDAWTATSHSARMPFAERHTDIFPLALLNSFSCMATGIGTLAGVEGRSAAW